MKFNAYSVRLLCPLFVAVKLRADSRLPERDVAHSADAVNKNEFCSLGLQFRKFFGISGKIVLRREVSLRLGNGQFAEFVEKRFLHRIFKRRVIGRVKGIALAVSPLVHVERRDMIAANVPFFQEVYRPLVHSHRSYGKDHREFFASVSRLFDLQSDLMTHICVEIGNGVAGNGLEVFVPESLFLCAFFTAFVDLLHVPALRIKTFKSGTFYG